MYRTFETITAYVVGGAAVALLAPLAFFWTCAMLQVVGIL